MSLIDRAVGLFAPQTALRMMQAREALTQFRRHAARPGRERGRTPSVGNTSPNTSQLSVDRCQLIWEARELCENFALIKGLLRKLALYTFGSIRYEPQTSDQEVNRQYKAYLETWWNNCDLGKRHDLTTLTNLIFLSMLRDGDVGVNVVMKDEEVRLQIIEADRIGHPTTQGGKSSNEVGGVTFDPHTGEPICYKVYERTKEGQYQNPIDIPASAFIHLFDPMRADEVRGVTALDAAIDTARDIYDIFRYEKFAVKWASAQTGVVKSEDGEFKWDQGTDAGKPLDEIEFGTLNYLRPNEDIQTFRNDRPSVTFSGFMETLQRDICHSLGVPFGFFVDNSKLGGASGRLDSQQANRVCSRFQEFFKTRFLDRVKNLVLAHGILHKRIPAVSDFKVGKWQFPAWPSSDAGRETSANIEEWKMGLRTAADVYGERSESWREQYRQKAIEMKELMDLSKELGVPLDMLCSISPNPNTAPPGAEGAPQEPQPPQV